MRAARAEIGGLATEPARQRVCSADGRCVELAKGLGGFSPPPDMWVGEPATLEFVVGASLPAVRRQVGTDVDASRFQQVFMARRMRVTLEEHPQFEIVGRNGEVKTLASDMQRASWRWTVKPRPGAEGSLQLVAKVEPLADGASAEALDAYEERVTVRVQVGTWNALKTALANARDLGDLVTAVSKSWEASFVALAALLAAIGGFLAALRALRRGQPSPDKTAAAAPPAAATTATTK